MRTLILLLTTVILISNAEAQIRKRPLTLSGSMAIGEPRGEFNSAFGKDILGLSGNFSVPFKRLPFESGLQYTWGRMGAEKHTVEVNEEYTKETEGRVSAKSNIHAYHGFLRFKPLPGKFAPYVDGIAGFRSFTTRTKLTVADVEGPLTNDVVQRDGAMSYGWAVGLMVGLNKVMYVEGRFEKLQGSEVTYVDPTTLAIDDFGGITYDTRTSNTDVMNVMLGIGFRF